jgi:hypothetical protein
MKDITNLGVSNNVRPWEIPAGIILDTVTWTNNNGLMTVRPFSRIFVMLPRQPKSCVDTN